MSITHSDLPDYHIANNTTTMQSKGTAMNIKHVLAEEGLPENSVVVYLNTDSSNLVNNIPVKHANVLAGSCVYNLWETKNIPLTNCTKNIVFSLKDSTTTSFTLPEKEDEQRLLDYLRSGPIAKIFDCQSFVHYIKGVNFTDHNSSYKTLRDKRDADNPHDYRVVPGDCIMLYSTYDQNNNVIHNISHFAYYIGHGFYLSKSGKDTGLMITTLKQMHAIYGTKAAMVLHKK